MACDEFRCSAVYVEATGKWETKDECPQDCNCALAFTLDPFDGEEVSNWCKDRRPPPPPPGAAKRPARKNPKLIVK